MRFVHTADLHLGRRIAQMSLEEDLECVLAELSELVVRSRAQALVVAGDVFDSPSPQESATRQWGRLITRMAESGVAVLAVGGNQDAGAHRALGSETIARPGIHIAGELKGEVACVEVGGVNFWLIPFVRPADVRAWALEQGISWEEPRGCEDALRLVCDHIRSLSAFSARPNVAVAHQLVADGTKLPVRSDFEQAPLGIDDGLEAVDYTCFTGFDYVALGHLHDPQCVGRETCRYAGSPLKLSAFEASQSKSFTVVGIKETDQGVRVKTKNVAVEPLRDFRVERGTLAELAALAESEDERRRRDFVHAVVLDGDETDVAGRLREAWPNLEQVVFENVASGASAEAAPATDAAEATLVTDNAETVLANEDADLREATMASEDVEATLPTEGAETTPATGTDLSDATLATDAAEATLATDDAETTLSTEGAETVLATDNAETTPATETDLLSEATLSTEDAETVFATEGVVTTFAADDAETTLSTEGAGTVLATDNAETAPATETDLLSEATLATDADLSKDVIDLFYEFFERETGVPLSSEQEKMVADAYERAARKGDE